MVVTARIIFTALALARIYSRFPLACSSLSYQRTSSLETLRSKQHNRLRIHHTATDLFVRLSGTCIACSVSCIYSFRRIVLCIIYLVPLLKLKQLVVSSVTIYATATIDHSTSFPQVVRFALKAQLFTPRRIGS